MPDPTIWAIQWHRKWARNNFRQAQAYLEMGWLDQARYHQTVAAHHYAAALERLTNP